MNVSKPKASTCEKAQYVEPARVPERLEGPLQWIYLERMLPGEFSYEIVKQRWGGGAYRIRLFGAWDRARRQEKFITQVAFWIWSGFPPTPALQARLRQAKSAR